MERKTCHRQNKVQLQLVFQNFQTFTFTMERKTVTQHTRCNYNLSFKTFKLVMNYSKYSTLLVCLIRKQFKNLKYKLIKIYFLADWLKCVGHNFSLLWCFVLMGARLENLMCHKTAPVCSWPLQNWSKISNTLRNNRGGCSFGSMPKNECWVVKPLWTALR